MVHFRCSSSGSALRALMPQLERLETESFTLHEMYEVRQRKQSNVGFIPLKDTGQNHYHSNIIFNATSFIIVMLLFVHVHVDYTYRIALYM